MRRKAAVTGRWHDNRHTLITEMAESGQGTKRSSLLPVTSIDRCSATIATSVRKPKEMPFKQH